MLDRPDCPSIALALPFGEGEKRVYLVRGFDAGRLCRDDGYQALSAAQATWALVRPDLMCLAQMRTFLVQSRSLVINLEQTDDHDLAECVRQWLRRGDLVAVRRVGAGRSGDGAAEQRNLAREVSAAAKGNLHQGRRQYKLVAGIDVDKVADRESFTVVPRVEAKRILENIAKEAGGSSGLRDALAKAMAALSRDWQPPLSPDGLVLLRKLYMPARVQADTAVAVTPSAIKKMKDEGWIEIAMVDAGGEPIADVDFDLRLADGSSESGKTNAKGEARFQAIVPGECCVRFPNLKTPVVLL